MKLNQALLIDAVGCAPGRAQMFVGPLNETTNLFDIETPERMASFLAQTGHESQSFWRLKESLDYAADKLVLQFGDHRITPEQAHQYGRRAGQKANQTEIANIVYGGAWGKKHLGNTEPGDGARYIGRALIGVSGRANYCRCRDALRILIGAEVPDFEATPEALELPRWAALAGGEFWFRNGCNELADAGRFRQMTKVINGYLNGYADRIIRLEKARQALARASAP